MASYKLSEDHIHITDVDGREAVLTFEQFGDLITNILEEYAQDLTAVVNAFKERLAEKDK